MGNAEFGSSNFFDVLFGDPRIGAALQARNAWTISQLDTLFAMVKHLALINNTSRITLHSGGIWNATSVLERLGPVCPHLTYLNVTVHRAPSDFGNEFDVAIIERYWSQTLEELVLNLRNRAGNITALSKLRSLQCEMISCDNLAERLLLPYDSCESLTKLKMSVWLYTSRFGELRPDATGKIQRMLERFDMFKNLKEYTAVPLTTATLTILSRATFPLTCLHISIEHSYMRKQLVGAFLNSSTFRHLEELSLKLKTKIVVPNPDRVLRLIQPDELTYEDVSLIIDSFTTTLSTSLERLTIKVPYKLEWCKYFSRLAHLRKLEWIWAPRELLTEFIPWHHCWLENLENGRFDIALSKAFQELTVKPEIWFNSRFVELN
jgi:hypothetical protein